MQSSKYVVSDTSNISESPTEKANNREEGQLYTAQTQMESVDRNFMRESDPRMPVLNPERSSRTSFGKS